ncbi:MAG: UDP-3-O-(3-hydroxymyristoyl)glucosamine N-acyltransferase [Paludibacteraceae bacterium]|nr:UDP-3-O-(3-hydroxymyristoyl)glucosamine N-acyltransferase [Paludibacteraceae bacterium]
MEFSAQQIAMLLGGKIMGDANRKVSDVGPIESAHEGQLSFLCDAKYLPHLPQTGASVVLMTDSIVFDGETNATLIRVENARAAMGQLLSLVAKAMNPAKQGVEQPSFVSEGVAIPEDAYIGAFAYIGKNVQLGKGVQIYPHTYIGDNVKIGDNTILYSGVKVYYNCVIGKDCILHAGVVIGSDGFGFEPDAKGVNQKLPQIGNVIIEDDVEIGANTTVDRAMMGSTIIHRNAKLDNLVQVAHNVEIGESTFMCAQVGVAGSTKVGGHCILAGQVGVAGHITIADNCVFGAQSGIANNVKKSGMYQGSPIIDAMNWRRSVVGFKQLPDLIKKIQELEKKQQ